MSKVIVAGGGAAGMMAAAAAALSGHETAIYEKNEKLGKKVYITGKGRCNVTNGCSMEELLNRIVTNRKFLYSSFYGFTNEDMMDFLVRHGCPLKTERGMRVFPVSDKSSDVIAALTRVLKEAGVKIHLNQEIKSLIIEDGICRGIQVGNQKIFADAVIVAAGGLSYPATGSTGDGLKWARESGHEVTSLRPALVPFNIKEEDPLRLQGLSLKNVQVTVKKGKKVLYQEFGEMLFTHFGVSGPVILSASSFVGKDLEKGPLALFIDLKPALTLEQLDDRILRDFQGEKNKQFKNSLSRLLPSKLIPIIVERSGIDPNRQVNEITREERRRLAALLKDYPLTITGLRSFKEAIITQGGVSVKEINPSTMESKRVKGLYFAGEVLDLDAVTGGFNLQIAWSTGWAAGSSVPF